MDCAVQGVQYLCIADTFTNWETNCDEATACSGGKSLVAMVPTCDCQSEGGIYIYICAMP